MTGRTERQRTSWLAQQKEHVVNETHDIQPTDRRHGRRRLGAAATLVAVLGATLATGIPVANAAAIPDSVAVGGQAVSVAVNEKTNTIYATSTANGTVSVIDGKTNTLTATITVGTWAHGVGVNEKTNTVYVSNAGSGTVSVIDGARNVVTDTITVGERPSGLAVNEVTDTVYVVNANSGSLSIIDGRTKKVSDTVGSLGQPYRVAVNELTNTIYLAGDRMRIIDAATHALTSFPYYGSGVAVNPATARIYASSDLSDSLNVLNARDGSLVQRITVKSPGDSVVDERSNTVFVSNRVDGVTVVDGATGAVRGTLPVAGEPGGVAFNSTTNSLYVVTDDGFVRTFRAPTLTLDSPPANAVAGSTYSYSFAADGVPAATFAVASGGLPAGLSLSAEGVLSGAPTVDGSFRFAVTATNLLGSVTGTTHTLTVAAVAPRLTADAPTGRLVVGTPYSYSFAASGTPAPSFSVSSGTLPDGLTLSAAGVLSGNPTRAGAFAFAVKAVNGGGQVTGTSHSVTVEAAKVVASTPAAAKKPVSRSGEKRLAMTGSSLLLPGLLAAGGLGVVIAGLVLVRRARRAD